MNLKSVFETLLAGKELPEDDMRHFIEACMSGELSDAQIAVFLALMRMKGESVAELSTAARTILQFAKPLDLGDNLLDMVGTGGDGRNTFNVSTAACFVVAGAGIKVAKHGNRSISSQSGSADLLELAGVNLVCTEEQHKNQLENCNLTFLYAPAFHPALQHVRKARTELGFRTFFNLLGPLLNPAGAKRQVTGVYSAQWLRPVAEVLVHMQTERCLVVHSRDGLDEISIAAVTDVVEYYQGVYRNWTIDPGEYGLFHEDLAAVQVNSPKESLDLIHRVLSREKGPARDMVLLNAAAAIYCAKSEISFEEALHQAAISIDNNAALYCFNQLCTLL